MKYGINALYFFLVVSIIYIGIVKMLHYIVNDQQDINPIVNGTVKKPVYFSNNSDSKTGNEEQIHLINDKNKNYILIHKDDFMWYKKSTLCDVTCGKGYQKPILYCVDKQSKSKVPQKYCLASLPKPHVFPIPCSLSQCEVIKWVTGTWSRCNKSCGDNRVRERQIFCQSSPYAGYIQHVEESICNDKAVNEKPLTIKRCKKKSCPGENRKSNSNHDKKEVCTVDSSFYCHGNTEHCYNKAYREHCCKTCAEYDPQDYNDFD